MHFSSAAAFLISLKPSKVFVLDYNNRINLVRVVFFFLLAVLHGNPLENGLGNRSGFIREQEIQKICSGIAGEALGDQKFNGESAREPLGNR